MRVSVLILALVASALSTESGLIINPALKASFQANKGGALDIIIIMKSSTTQVLEKIQKQSFASSDSKTTALYNELNKFTSESQKQVLSIIAEFQGSNAKGFYITNKVLVKSATWELVQALSDRLDILEIREEKVLQRDNALGDKAGSGGFQEEAEWGVANINAPQAWAMNITGKGVVIGSIDSGVRGTHEVLAQNFRVDHGWLDPQENSSVPVDYTTLGTHLMGVAVGKSGIGVAPDAQWITCAGCAFFGCPEGSIYTCGEFILCPTNADSSDADCSKRPNIVNNAWNAGFGDTSYNDVISSWKEAGIIPVFSSGNSGPGCSTVRSPGDQPNVISVGGTDSNNTLSGSGSRGPSQIEQLIKPELTAPGINIRSAVGSGDQDYQVVSATSIASSHVAGALALLLQENPALTRDLALSALGDSAFRPELENLECTEGGVDPNNPWPNNLYGFGKIDVAAALAIIQSK